MNLHVSGAHVRDPDPAELLLHLPGGRQPRHLRRQGGEALLLLGHQQTLQSGRIGHTQLSPAIILMSDGAHDGGIIQSELFTSRRQNLVSGKLQIWGLTYDI